MPFQNILSGLNYLKMVVFWLTLSWFTVDAVGFQVFGRLFLPTFYFFIFHSSSARRVAELYVCFLLVMYIYFLNKSARKNGM